MYSWLCLSVALSKNCDLKMWAFFGRDASKDFGYDVGDSAVSFSGCFNQRHTFWKFHAGKKKVSIFQIFDLVGIWFMGTALRNGVNLVPAHSRSGLFFGLLFPAIELELWFLYPIRTLTPKENQFTCKEPSQWIWESIQSMPTLWATCMSYLTDSEFQHPK